MGHKIKCSQDQVLSYRDNEHHQSVPDLVDSWRQHDGISKASRDRKTLNDGKTVLDSYHMPKQQPAVVLYTIKREHGKPIGHVWFSEDLVQRTH